MNKNGHFLITSERKPEGETATDSTISFLTARTMQYTDMVITPGAINVSGISMDTGNYVIIKNFFVFPCYLP
jgi:hypothetical protein